MSKVMRPRTHCTMRTMRWLSVAVAPAGGMKSTTWPMPSSVKNRVTRTAVSGRYICLEVYAVFAGRIRKWPPRSSSSSAPNTLGESKRGQQNQSIDPSVVTRAAVCRSPMIPCSAMAVSSGAVTVMAATGSRAPGGPPHPPGVMSPRGPADHRGCMRRFVTGLLILISAITLLLASTSLWTRRNVVNTQVFVSNVETMVDLPAVEARIADRVTTTVMTNPDVQAAIDEAVTVLPDRLQRFRPTVENGIRSLISAGVSRLLTSDPFRPLTEAALVSAHDQLVAGQPVRFTLGQAKQLVPQSAQDGLAGQVLALLPDDVGVTVLTPADAPEVYNAIDLLKSVWWWLGLIALATLIGALGTSRHRRATLRAWAVTSTVLLLLLLVTLRVLGGRVVAAAKPENRNAVSAIYGVLAGSLRSWTLWLVVVVLV